MARILIGLLFAGSVLLLSNVSPALAQEPDGTVKITRRFVSEGVGMSWGDGVLTYKVRIILSPSRLMGSSEMWTSELPPQNCPVRYSN